MRVVSHEMPRYGPLLARGMMQRENVVSGVLFRQSLVLCSRVQPLSSIAPRLRWLRQHLQYGDVRCLYGHGPPPPPRSCCTPVAKEHVTVAAVSLAAPTSHDAPNPHLHTVSRLVPFITILTSPPPHR